ncbi:MAG: hypothetical protein RLY57_530 [Candidatus Parcubacteria bacterium]|jgi:hypothetical protein
MKKIIMSIVGVAIIGLVIWGVSNSQKENLQHQDNAIQATTTQATTTGNTATLEDNRLPPEQPVAPARPSQGLSLEYVPTLVQNSLRLGLNESGTAGKITVTPKKMYDTRCPKNTKCTEEGAARVIFEVDGPVTSKNINMIEGQAFMLDNIRVTLVQVLPDRVRNETIEDNQYVFKLLVESAQ